MEQLVCPKCGTQFSIDDAHYAAIVSQVKNKEFNAEVEKRMKELNKQVEAEQKARAIQAEQNFQNRLNESSEILAKKTAELERLKAQIESAEKATRLAVAEAVAKKDQEISSLKEKVGNLDALRTQAVKTAEAKKDQEIAILKQQIANNATEVQKAVSETKLASSQSIQEKEKEISDLKNQILSGKNEAHIRETSLKETHLNEVKKLQEMIDYYKDLKAKLSTKMIGESLEIHCQTQFEQMIRPLLPNAYFEKDNEVVNGTKGDFVFKDYEDGFEYVSIMFEMKNECDTTASKHKNEDFLDKLDKDRREKKCEYAVLVSMLEPENELYNSGIVNKSHRYEKMYVIRPQFFIPLLQLLVETSKKSLSYKKELELAKRQTIDVTNFESDLEKFKEKFGRDYRLAKDKFESAIKRIDDQIKGLQKIKEDLLGSEKHLHLAGEKAESLTVKKLTKNNETMKRMFEEAKRNATDVDVA